MKMGRSLMPLSRNGLRLFLNACFCWMVMVLSGIGNIKGHWLTNRIMIL